MNEKRNDLINKIHLQVLQGWGLSEDMLKNMGVDLLKNSISSVLQAYCKNFDEKFQNKQSVSLSDLENYKKILGDTKQKYLEALAGTEDHSHYFTPKGWKKLMQTTVGDIYKAEDGIYFLNVFLIKRSEALEGYPVMALFLDFKLDNTLENVLDQALQIARKKKFDEAKQAILKTAREEYPEDPKKQLAAMLAVVEEFYTQKIETYFIDHEKVGSFINSVTTLPKGKA